VGELVFPVPAVDPATVRDTFLDARAGGLRTHHAVDIAAPRESPVVAVADGSVDRLANGPLGGISLYQRDAGGRYCYYYAHLARYADGLADGQPVRRGQTVGYVGTTGNAPANAPHLHFAVHEADRSCHGRPVDPLPLLRGARKAPVG
jgi:murein DD-endopeptidase MepM/ murein hydrolase activator NlpD